MARARPGLQKAINEILERNGSGGKPLSLRQAERRTGLSPATIGELAKGNARTPETLRRFAKGFGENIERLLLLAGFAEAIDLGENRSPTLAQEADRPDAELSDWLHRYGRALRAVPPGRTRSLLLTRLRCDTELIESLLAGPGMDGEPGENGTKYKSRSGAGAAIDQYSRHGVLNLNDESHDALDRESG